MESDTYGQAGEELNAFIGRERELAELGQLARDSRALTLCGAGGIGKTRLTVRLLAQQAADFSDGAWFVELADLRQPDLVASRIASVVGVVEEPGRALLWTLADALRPRQILIGLDNCEHLIDECARICQRLLASSPGLRVIASSREPLRVAAETVWQVPPLALPPSGTPAGSELLASDALRLFADRAASAKPGFALGPANLGPVTAICRALDGLPLAIELAAAWVRVLTVEQIAARLADRFRLLSSAERTAPPRHRTLRAAIDWSHDLLEPREKVLLRRLSVFAGCTLEMAEHVCALPESDGQGPRDALAASEIVDLLTALADKSLVVAEHDPQGRIRYRMLDTIAEYAAVRLAEAGEADLLHARFRDYAMVEVEQVAHIGMAQAAAPWSFRADAFRRFEAEAANMRRILGRCQAEGNVEAGLRICAAMRPVWIVQGSFDEGKNWIDSFLRLDTSGLPDQVLGSGLIGRAQLALATDPAGPLDYATAGLELCRGEGAEFWAASALNLLAEAALHADQPDQAIDRADEALAIARAAGDRWNEAYACGTRAAVVAKRGDLTQAKQLAEAALAIMREIDQLWGAARTLLGLGDLARVTGDPDGAQGRYAEALIILREIGARPDIARCLAGLGRIAIGEADLEAAQEYLAQSLELSHSSGSRIGVIRALDSFATLAAARGDPRLAVRLAAGAAALRRPAGLPVQRPERIQRVMEAAAGLGESAIDALWAEGASLSGDAAVALALQSGKPGESSASWAPPGLLTGREREIVALIAQGLSNKAIADRLFISKLTVARHIANIMAKLGFSSRVQIAGWSLRATERGTAR